MVARFVLKWTISKTFLTVKYLYPTTDNIPAITPINMAPCGPISRLHTEPTATPPKTKKICWLNKHTTVYGACSFFFLLPIFTS